MNMVMQHQLTTPIASPRNAPSPGARLPASAPDKRIASPVKLKGVAAPHSLDSRASGAAAPGVLGQQPIAPRGRGAAGNVAHRFETLRYEALDDGWSADDAASPQSASAFPTNVTAETARSIINFIDSPDLGFDRTLNPYQGCEHGCAYCYARPNHAYLGLSPGLDFESRLFYKANAPALLAQEFSAKNYIAKPIMIGAATDAYQPIERDLNLTRRLLQVCLEYRHPVSIVTKSALIVRDLDILSTLATRNLVKVALSVTSLDPHLSRLMEPRAAAPHRRLWAMRQLSDAGVPVSVMMAPIIPALNDTEIEAVMDAAHDHGASRAGYVFLRLPHEVKEVFGDWLSRHFPDRARRVMSHVLNARGGRAYDSRFGSRQVGTGPYAELIGQRFRKACARAGLNKSRIELDVHQFRVPGRPVQLSLL